MVLNSVSKRYSACFARERPCISQSLSRSAIGLELALSLSIAASKRSIRTDTFSSLLGGASTVSPSVWPLTRPSSFFRRSSRPSRVPEVSSSGLLAAIVARGTPKPYHDLV